MYNNVSDAYKATIRSPSRTFRGRLKINDKWVYANFKKLSYETSSGSEEYLQLGSAVSAKIELTIKKIGELFENTEIPIEIGLKLPTGKYEYVPVGLFTAEHPTSNQATTTFTAYDRMMRTTGVYVSELSYPASALSVMNEISAGCGVPVDVSNIDSSIMISTKPAGYTYREMIGYIASMAGGFACVDRTGTIVIKWYSDVDYKLDVTRIMSFEKDESNYNLEKLSCNVDNSTTLTSGGGILGVTFDNPFMTQDRLDNIFKKLSGFSYRGASVKTLGDVRLDPWDVITVEDGEGTYKVPVMNIQQEYDGGLTMTITAYGKTQTEQEVDFKGPTTQQNERIYSDLVLTKELIAKKVDADWVKANTVQAETIVSINNDLENIRNNYLKSNVAEIRYATIDDLNVANAKITDLKANMLTADIADLNYAKVDFANVIGQVVGTSLIKDGAVTNEKVQNLSANKITSGTIDASKITVTNLNADNITVGTINGKRIGNGSINLDKLSEEVPTKEYLDKVQDELQGQIDGNIETFTKTEIPTLNNDPAVNWTDNVTRKKHIGDICYVVNPASSADGYSYRFADTGTLEAPNYEWVLIKDSDVTKALQDIININGEITGIKNFNIEVSSWKTDTSEELSSLKKRTTTIETDYSTKQEVTDKINGIQVGGVNILPNSITLTNKGWTGTTSTTLNQLDPFGGSKAVLLKGTSARDSYRIIFNVFKENGDYTISFWAKADKQFTLFVCEGNNRVFGKAALTTSWGYYTYTYNVTDINSSNRFYFGGGMSWQDISVNVYIAFVKLEKGTKATDWSPAPEDVDTALNTKVSTTVFNEVKQTVDENSANITKMTETIKTKADGSTVTTLTNTVNSVKQTADSNSSSISTLSTTVSNLSNTVSNQGSSITQLQGSITNKVWKTDITESVNNLQVGGTNMLLWTTTMPGKFSSDSSGASSKGTVSYQSDGSAFVINNNSNFRFQYHPDVNVMIGATYVVSAYYRDVSGAQAHQFQIAYATASGKYADFHGVTGTREVGDGWKQSYLVFTIPDTIKTSNLITVYLRSGADYTLYNHSYYIKNVKLELGNKVTTWSPAPEDVSSGINAVDTKVTTVSNQYTILNQTVNSISGTVNSHTEQIKQKADGSTVTELSTKTSKLEQNLNGFKTTVSSTYTTKTEFNNLQVGGRNLALVSKTFESGSDKWSIGTGWSRSVDSNGFTIMSYSRSGATSVSWNRLIPHKYIMAEDMHKGIVVSFDFKCDSLANLDGGCICSLQNWTASNVRIGWVEHVNIKTMTGLTTDKPLKDGEWVRVSVPFPEKYLRLKQLQDTSNDVAYSSVSFQLTKNGSIHIRKVKIEYGNKATDWSPAPEDIDEKFTDYSTTTQMNAAISTAISKESSAIKLEVSGTYATKKSLKSYATTASLSAYIKKNPATGELKSAIEAIADTINITARGGLNLSGNRFTLNSTNTTITANGTITSNNIIANYGKIAQWNIANNSINSTTSDSKYWAGMTTPSKGSDWVYAIMSNSGTASVPSWSPQWYVAGNGFMYAASAAIAGSITATKSGVLTTTVDASGISVTGSDNSTVITAQGFLTNQYLGSTIDCRGTIFDGMLIYPKGKTDLKYEWVTKLSNKSIEISPDNVFSLTYCTKMTNEEISIFGQAVTGPYAKMATYGFSTTGNLYCGGTKNRMVETEHFGTVLQNALETPTPTFEDYGEGILDETGMCRIYLEDKFIETIDTNTEYTIFLTKYGIGDIYVSDRQPDYFEVTGTPNLTFSWQLLATQRDYNSIRLDEKTDSIIDKVNSDELFKMTTEFIAEWEGDLDYAE